MSIPTAEERSVRIKQAEINERVQMDRAEQERKKAHIAEVLLACAKKLKTTEDEPVKCYAGSPDAADTLENVLKEKGYTTSTDITFTYQGIIEVERMNYVPFSSWKITGKTTRYIGFDEQITEYTRQPRVWTVNASTK